MKTWTVSCFGREVVRVEMREEASIADVVRHLVARRLGVDESDVEVEISGPDCDYEDIAGGLVPCECCGEMFDPDDDSGEVDARFADMTEHLVWGGPAEEPDDDRN